MFYKKLYLKDLSKDFKDSVATLEIYRMEYNNDFAGQKIIRPGLLVIPGGGYEGCSDREAEPIALRFLSEGFNCFVLRYTCKQKYPVPQREVIFASNYIREHYEEFELLDIGLTLIGFSAGAHLAGTIGYVYEEVAKELNINPKMVKPFALMLCYPVVSSVVGVAHEGSIINISNNEKELREKMSIEKHVTKEYPPTYIWHTEDDLCVPVENSYVLAKSLEKNRVPYKMHIFKSGIHGGSLCTRGVYLDYDDSLIKMEENSVWVKEACDFVFRLIFKY